MVYHLCSSCADSFRVGGYFLFPSDSGGDVRRKCEFCRMVRLCRCYEVVSLRCLSRAEARSCKFPD